MPCSLRVVFLMKTPNAKSHNVGDISKTVMKEELLIKKGVFISCTTSLEYVMRFILVCVCVIFLFTSSGEFECFEDLH